jgi:hypothetical protein
MTADVNATSLAAGPAFVRSSVSQVPFLHRWVNAVWGLLAIEFLLGMFINRYFTGTLPTVATPFGPGGRATPRSWRTPSSGRCSGSSRSSCSCPRSRSGTGWC